MENKQTVEEITLTTDSKSKYMSIWEAIGAMLFMIIGGGAASMLLLVTLGLIFPSLTVADTGMIATVFMMLITIIFLHYQKKWSVKSTSDSKYSFFGGNIKFYYVLIALLVAEISSILLEPYMIIIPDKYFQEYYEMFFSGNMIITFVVGVLIIPVVEEVIFRGYILRGLERRYGAIQAIVYSSIIFAAVHFSLVQTPSAFLGSIVMSIIYVITRYSLSTVIMIHALNNLFAFAIPYFFGIPDIKEDTLIYYIDNNTLYIIVYGITLIGYVALLILGFKRVKAGNVYK